ncbi:DUF3010 family protein [Marinobacterium arenosum]|uniref:DUF3010 family protein n=1 Tax=Marinobacterium arenosum TaxID=2862496 RepID=UPI001C957312|nr:DUF3010 family protein [Marinobacterium arenosum]MBY4677299.1 DUF3010 family protein [Marinobacterium arenosum]
MKVCGVELKGNEAIICILSLADGLFEIANCRVSRLAIRDSEDSEQLKKFQFDFAKLMDDYQVGAVVIRQRPMKGKFAGGAVGFKLEAAIQLIDPLKVEIMPTNEIRETVKRSPLAIDFKATGLKQFQEPAFTTAFAYLSR